MTTPTTLFTGLDIDQTTGAAVAESVGLGLRRSGAKAESFSRSDSTVAAQTITTAQATAVLIELGAGTVVSNLVFTAIGASSAMTNNFAALYGSSKAKPLAISADKTSTAVSANSEVTYAMTTPYTVPTDGVFYAVLSTTGTGLPTWAGVTGNATINGRAPAVAFTDSTTTYSNPASAPSPIVATAGTASVLYVQVT